MHILVIVGMMLSKGSIMVIGLIGGIGTGKSAIADILEKNYESYIINADNIGHGFLKKSSVCYNELICAFGERILDHHHNIDRKELSKIVFNDQIKLTQLNAIIHPVMKKKIQELILQAKQTKQYQFIIVEAAILIEAGWVDLVDYIILVTCNHKERVKRLIASRDIDEIEAEMIISNQKKDEELLGYSNFVIDNSFNIENTEKQIYQMITRSKYEN